MTRIIPFTETTDPGAVPNNVLLYSKDSGGVTKLYVQYSDGTVVEIGAGGGGGSLPLFVQNVDDVALTPSPPSNENVAGTAFVPSTYFPTAERVIVTVRGSLVVTPDTGAYFVLLYLVVDDGVGGYTTIAEIALRDDGNGGRTVYAAPIVFSGVVPAGASMGRTVQVQAYFATGLDARFEAGNTGEPSISLEVTEISSARVLSTP